MKDKTTSLKLIDAFKRKIQKFKTHAEFMSEAEKLRKQLAPIGVGMRIGRSGISFFDAVAREERKASERAMEAAILKAMADSEDGMVEISSSGKVSPSKPKRAAKKKAVKKGAGKKGK